MYAIYILEPETERLLRALSLRQLISGRPEASILSITPDRRPIVAPPLMDREDVARLISKYDLLAVPVVDDQRHVLGIVTFDDIIDSMIEESTEDVQRLGGMEAIERSYVDTGFIEMIRKRGGWLAVLFMGEMLTASAMQHYEAELAKAVVLTLFIPLIISSGGNSGSQATSLLIRALALQQIELADWWRVVLRELPAGIALGAILGVIGMGRIALWQVAGFLRLWRALEADRPDRRSRSRRRRDLWLARRVDAANAHASNEIRPRDSLCRPFVATLVDVTGIAIYLSIAVVLLSGTVL